MATEQVKTREEYAFSYDALLHIEAYRQLNMQLPSNLLTIAVAIQQDIQDVKDKLLAQQHAVQDCDCSADMSDQCDSRSRHARYCTRPRGHSGRHMACLMHPHFGTRKCVQHNIEEWE